jgi:hypothetical protein
MSARDPLERGLPVPKPEQLTLAAKPVHKGILIPPFVEKIVAKGPQRTADLTATLDGIAVALACDESAQSSNAIKISYQ